MLGYSISWIGVQAPLAEALEIMNFKDTRQVDEANEAPFSAAYLPTGWTIIWANDIEYASPSNVTHASRFARAIGCLIEENVMVSVCRSAKDGDSPWAVWHDAEKGIYDIQTSGEFPVEFEAIAANHCARQEAEGGENSSVDYCFDAPLELAAQWTGYRHDRYKFDWGEPRFTVIEQSD